MADRFLTAGLTRGLPELHRVTSFQGYSIWAPLVDPQAGLLVLGLPESVESFHVTPSTLGWTLVERERRSDVGQHLSFVRRLGVSRSRMVIVAFDQAWAAAAEIAMQAPECEVVLIATPSCDLDTAFARVWQGKEAATTAVNTVLNRVDLTDRTYFVVPQGTDLAPLARCNVAFYPREVMPNTTGPAYYHLLHLVSHLPTILACGGNLISFCTRYWSGRDALLPAGFLPYLYGKAGFGRQILLQLEFAAEGLRFFGLDLAPARPATGWGARRHTLKFRHITTGLEIPIPIGNLKREILDALPLVATRAETQAYGVFAVSKNDPIVWNEFEDGTYALEILDEEGVDIVPLAKHVLLNETSTVESRDATITSRDGQLLLTIHSTEAN